MSGGEISNMEIEKSLSVHGLQETIAYLHKIEMGVLKDFEYIEFRTCREGCLGGVLTASILTSPSAMSRKWSAFSAWGGACPGTPSCAFMKRDGSSPIKTLRY